MTIEPRTILVATAGQGILRSNNDGAHWHRLGLDEAIEFDGTVRTLPVDPVRPWRVYAGADCGFCISDDGGARWHRPDGALAGKTVWSIAVDTHNPQIIFAGTGAPTRAAIHRSVDAGRSWERIGPEIPEFCAGVNRPRLLTICIDPDDSRQVWFGVEKGGAWRSGDSGDTWSRIDAEGSGGIRNSDVHAVSILPKQNGTPKTTLVAVVNCLHRSTDDGETWDDLPSRERFQGLYYTRTVAPLPDGSGLLLAVGDGTPGTRSRIYRSTDRGSTWTEATLGAAPNSTFWAFATHAADPNLIFAGTKYGHLFRSNDGGRTWNKEWREFSEITAIAWTPTKAPLTAHV